LFENTFKVEDSSVAEKVFLCEEHRNLAREFAAASLVLLKNENILPLDKSVKNKTAVIGPYVEELNLHGSWSFPTQSEKTVTVKQGILNKISEAVWFSKGCYLMDKGCPDRFENVEEYDEEQAMKWIEEAEGLAEKTDQVVLCLGEAKEQSGESASRTKLSVPNVQMNLLRRIHRKNENIITVLFTGRPLDVSEITELSRAVLVVWRPGTEGGNAIADVLYGDYVPQGKLTMSFPRSNAQLPIYYNRFNTGRPNNEYGTKIVYCNGYIDENRYPLYPFGYGLSYTTFEYSPIILSSHKMTKQQSITASVMIKNTGTMTATETVQMYLRDINGSVVRPVKSLKAFKKVTLKPNEYKKVEFEITEEMLRFYNIDMEYQSEAGDFEVYIGTDSETKNKTEFEYC
ncbi:MAG: glycoside hydrolase family 3 C-terminal domain-containing protein, partial [Clostridiales bacterium]|nr:glycoside hydrolase family 3 C-terminal domain-containing protein [Clostridiales bacterium]